MKIMNKISIIGIGGVGTYTACFCAALAEKMVIYNRRRSDDDERADGLVRDMRDALSHITGCNTINASSFEDFAGSDVVITTIGLGREYAFETRDMLFFKNASLIKSTMDNIYKISPETKIIIATNPVDYMGIIAKISGFPEENIFCLGGELDTARLSRYICDALGAKTGRYINPKKLEDIYVLGSHGPDMIPVFSHGKYEGKYIKDILDTDTMKEVVKNTISEGAIITKKKGKSAVIGPGASIARMIEKGTKGQYLLAHIYVNSDDLKRLGLDINSYDSNAFLGMPFRISSKKERQIMPVNLSDGEKAALIKFIDGQKARNEEVEFILTKTEGGLSAKEKVKNFISFMAQKGAIIKPILGEDGGYEIYMEGEDPKNAVSMNIWRYI